MFPRAAGAFSKQTETSRTPLIIVLGFLMIIRLLRPLNFVFWKYHIWGVLYQTSTFKYTLYLRSWNLDFPTKEGALAALLPNRSRHAGWRTHDLVWWWRRITVADDIWDHMVYSVFETLYFAVSVNCICQIVDLHFSRFCVMMTVDSCCRWHHEPGWCVTIGEPSKDSSLGIQQTVFLYKFRFKISWAIN